jgi:predicted phage baseplate assembly protein
MSDASDFIGRGIRFPMGVDQSGALATTDGADGIDDALRVVLMTAPGERLMRPHFGCRIWQLLFEPINANTLGLMAEAVREAVGRWEPRITLDDVRVDPGGRIHRSGADPHRLHGPHHQRPAQPRLPVLRDPPRGRIVSLPVPNLDDRKFQDIVDEAKRLIPRYCPEWTNHNLSDPGVALIELFAWMTEMTLYRLNQVPDAFYLRMLNLLGFEPFPAAAARVPLTFWLSSSQAQPVLVPAGTQVGTTGDVGVLRVFTTLEDLHIAQPTMVGALTSGRDESFADVWEDLSLGLASVRCFPDLTPGDCFYLGFERSLAGNAIRLDITATVEGIGVIPERPPLVWEIWQGEGWVPATVPPAGPGRGPADTTGGLNRDGNVLLLIPNAHEPLTLGGVRGFWLRARLLPAGLDQPSYRASPQLRRVVASSIGGTVVAEHSDVVHQEMIGVSVGKPDQIFQVRNTPVLPRRTGEVVQVVAAGVVEDWAEVDDFVHSGPDDRHLVWDSSTGQVRFGPLIRYPDGSTRQHGAIPPEGASIVVTTYRWGGGSVGNVGAGTITGLRSAIPYVASVENLTAAVGGVDAESVENAKLRGPQTLRAGSRAVTVTDFERLAVEADSRIARVRCLPPAEAGGPIRLLIVPAIEGPTEQLRLDDFALPDDMIERVSSHLDERRILGSTIEIGTPFYQGVTVAVLLSARPGRPTSLVRDRALTALYRYLNPISGGPDGHGWAFDADLNSASVYQLLEAVEGVERVEEVLFFEYDLRNHERIGFGKELVKLGADSLFMSTNHQVVVR